MAAISQDERAIRDYLRNYEKEDERTEPVEGTGSRQAA
jgi:hypothetical protein